jgi:uncharacterized membrane protein YdfJ with MMPL/SSD domain
MTTRVTRTAGTTVAGAGRAATRTAPRTAGNVALAQAPAQRSPERTATPGGTALRVAPPAPVAVPRTPFVVGVLVLVVAGVLGILVLNTKINENAFRLHDLQSSQARLDAQEQDLSQKLANQESPGNVAAAGRRQGLVPAGTPAFIRLPDGRVLGVPQPAPGR